MKSKVDLIREHALNDLEAFITLVHPQRVLGSCHRDLIRWWTRPEAKDHQLILMPRDHQKSALAAYRVAWEITKNPAIRVLYISATSNLATKQLKLIKDILTSPIYRHYWPEMVNIDEAKREKWTETEISVDHPRRKQEIVRDPTVFTAGLTTTITGLHCDIAVLDDVVIEDNAYSDEGRDKVRTQAGYLASIAGTESKVWAVGTRYHPKDLYADFSSMVVEIRSPDGEIEESYHLYEVYERQVEDVGDGTGQYLWPRMQRQDGRWFGFDQRELAKKRAQYSDQSKFRAQYYNDPNDMSSAPIDPKTFQYYNKNLLKQGEDSKWYYKDNRLNLTAAIDFAYSTSKEADFTTIAVVGCDAKNNYYVLDLARFKTNKTSDYFDRILQLYTKWNFRKIRAEVTAAQSIIVRDLRDNYIRTYGLALSIEDHRPTRDKESRILATLQPKYNNMQVWHYRGGNTDLLEEELVQRNPSHDDLKDALAAAIEIATPPSFMNLGSRVQTQEQYYNTRWGGIG